MGETQEIFVNVSGDLALPQKPFAATLIRLGNTPQSMPNSTDAAEEAVVPRRFRYVCCLLTHLDL